jgi:hypothetical protein
VPEGIKTSLWLPQILQYTFSCIGFLLGMNSIIEQHSQNYKKKKDPARAVYRNNRLPGQIETAEAFFHAGIKTINKSIVDMDSIG